MPNNIKKKNKVESFVGRHNADPYAERSAREFESDLNELFGGVEPVIRATVTVIRRRDGKEIGRGTLTA